MKRLLLTIALLTPLTSALAEEPGVVLREFIYEKASFPQCHASTIEQATAGHLVVAWFGGTAEKNPDVEIWVSRQENGRWTAPASGGHGVQNASERHPCWNPVLYQAKKGPLLLFFKVGPSPSTWWGEMCESSDGGKTWTKQRRLPESILGTVRSKPILLADGTLLCGSSTEHEGWRVHFETTKDLGKTWKHHGAIHDGKEFSAIQPTLLVYKDGSIQALCRSTQGVLAETWSKDGGKTWSKLERSPLPNPSAGADGVTLQDGRQLLVYNHTRWRQVTHPRARELLNVAVSKDGKSWDAAVVLENSRGEFSYPAVIQTKDGLVHTTYTWKRRKVRHVVIDPKKMKLMPIVDGKWPGLEPWKTLQK